MYISVLGLLLGAALMMVGYGKVGGRPRSRGLIVAGWIVLGIQIFQIVTAAIEIARVS